MPTTVRCKICGEQVEIAAGMAFDALVRCPLCKSESPLHLLLSGMAVAAPSTDATAQEASSADAAASPAVSSETAASLPPATSGEPTGAEQAYAGGIALAGDPLTSTLATPNAMSEMVPAAEAAPASSNEVVAAEMPLAPPVVMPAPPQTDALGPSHAFDLPHVPEDPEHHSADGAAVAGALMDLWKDAGVAPPLDMPETAMAEKPVSEHAPMPDAYEFSGAKVEGDMPPAAPRHSYSERARQAEKLTPRKTVRVVGMIVAGVLGVLVAWGLFSLFAGSRTPVERPANSSSSGNTGSSAKTKTAASKPKPAERKTDFSDLPPLK